MTGQHARTDQFEPTFESLWQYQVPEWFRDAKFGIWSHWGAQSVAMNGDWYARHMYVEERDQYLYHLGATFFWWRTNKGCDQYGRYVGVPYDGNEPEYRDFYLDNYEHVSPDGSRKDQAPWYSPNLKWHQYWLDVISEVIDRYQPDLLYSDGPLPFGGHRVSLPCDPAFDEGLKAAARLYNTSINTHGSNMAVYLQKDRRPEISSVGVLDIEKSQLPDIRQDVWHTDTCIGNWFYDVRKTYKKPGHIIEMLIDIIAKNGNMLLNILQKPDGSIDDETHWILDELADWYTICGEGVYGTRPWRVSGEGTSKVLIDGFKEVPVEWNASDVRFTSKGSTVYAFLLRQSERHVAILQSLTSTDLVRQVRLMGVGVVPFTQRYGVLTVQLPLSMPSKFTNCLAIELAQ